MPSLTSTAVVGFCTGTDPTPTILEPLRLADAIQVRGDTINLGFPAYEAAPDSVGGDYGWREVELPLQVFGTYGAVAARLSRIARLMTQRQWLCLQFSASAPPMFLRTYPTQQDALSWEASGAGVWEGTLRLTCDPHLYGPTETIGPVTIANDPAAATNPCFYELPAVKGDAPSPLVVQMNPSVAWSGFRPLMSSAAIDPAQTQHAPTVWQTGAFATAGADTQLIMADAAYSGGYKTSITFATSAGMVTRLSGAAPSAPPAAGRYKVLLRVGTSNSDTAFAARFGQQLTDLSYLWGPTVTVNRAAATSPGFVTWMDLGDFTFPVGASGLDISDAAGAVAVPNVALQVQSLGTPVRNVLPDVFLLVPVETAATVAVRTMASTFYTLGLIQNQYSIWDGYRRRVASYSSGGVLLNLMPPALDGGFLRVVPGVTNVFHLVHQTLLTTPGNPTTDTSDTIAATAAVTFSYAPRYLHMRPVNT